MAGNWTHASFEHVTSPALGFEVCSIKISPGVKKMSKQLCGHGLILQGTKLICQAQNSALSGAALQNPIAE